MRQNDKALLSRLREQNVEFVIIGGVCGVLHGALLVTLDLDICCRFTCENLRRLEAAVRDLHPRHRLTANKLPFELTDELCGSLKKLYLNTDWGVLDCVSGVSGIGGYEQVLRRNGCAQPFLRRVPAVKPGCAHRCKISGRAWKRFGSRKAPPSH